MARRPTAKGQARARLRDLPAGVQVGGAALGTLLAVQIAQGVLNRVAGQYVSLPDTVADHARRIDGHDDTLASVHKSVDKLVALTQQLENDRIKREEAAATEQRLRDKEREAFWREQRQKDRETLAERIQEALQKEKTEGKE